MIVPGVVDRLDRHFEDGISAGALEQHLRLELKSLAPHVQKFLHEGPRYAAQSRLGVGHPDAGHIVEDGHRYGIARPALPRHVISAKLSDAQHQLVRVGLQRLLDRRDARCRVLAVGVRRDAADRIRPGLEHIGKSGLERPSLSLIHFVRQDRAAQLIHIQRSLLKDLPEGVTALKVTEIKKVKELGLAVTEEIGREVAPQTPVLIKSETAGDITLTIDDNCGTAVTDNLLHGADWLINEYKINTPALESLFALVEGKVSESITDKYEHLLRRNSGTVNNKYFFPISVKKDLAPAYKEKNKGQEMKDTPIRILGKKGKFLAFNDSWDDLPSNAVFLFNEDYKPVFLNLIGDVDRDGDIDLDDVNATIDIVLGRDVSTKNYDFEAADVDEIYEMINIDDVNTLIDLVLNRISLKSLIENILNQ